MNKVLIWRTLGGLAFVAAAAMYYVGGNNRNLTELRDFWWTPLPLGFIGFTIAAKLGKNEE
jgi:hypothetical protein